MAFLVSGVGIMFGFVPFRTCPLLAQMFVCALSFFVCLLWLPTTFSLFFSLSRAGGTQTHFGFGFPLVSLQPGYALRPTIRTSSPFSPTPKSRSRSCVFFFFSFFVAVRAGLWSVFGSRVGSRFGRCFGLSVLVGLGLSRLLCSVHSCMILTCIRATAYAGIPARQWRLTPFPPFMIAIVLEVTRLLLGVDPGIPSDLRRVGKAQAEPL